MAKEWETSADDLPILDAAFWTVDREIKAVVEGARATTVGQGGQGTMYRLTLSEPVEIGGETAEEVEIGNLTGFRMWLEKLRREHGFDALHKGDILVLRCISIKKARKEGYSDSPRFSGRIVRK